MNNFKKAKLRKILNEINDHQYRIQQANRITIQKMIKTESNKKIAQYVETRNWVRRWIGMAFLANIVHVIDKKLKILVAKKNLKEKREAMAIRIQGTVLRKFYEKALNYRTKNSTRHEN